MARIVKSFRIEQEIWDRLEARSGNTSELVRLFIVTGLFKMELPRHVLLCLSNGRERLRFKKPQLIMLCQHQVEVAKEFSWEMQATRFQDRDFSLTGFIAPTKKKTLLERQAPHQCVWRM